MSFFKRPMARQGLAQASKPAASPTSRPAGARMKPALQDWWPLAGLETCATSRSSSFRLASLLLALVLPGFGCGARSEAARDAQSTNRPAIATSAQRVRAPAVAGLFYPGDAAALSKTIEGLLANAPDHSIPRLKALVCPHAGYEFSGQTAAIGYKLLAGRDVQTDDLMGATQN